VKYSLLVALREFADHTKTKGFWITIGMVPLLLFASIKVPMLLEKFARETRYFAVQDPKGEFTPVIDAAIQAQYEKKKGQALIEWLEEKKKDPNVAEFVPPKNLFVRVPLPTDVETLDSEPLREAAKPYLLSEKKIRVDGEETELFALVVVPTIDFELRNNVEYWSANLADDDLKDTVERAIQDELHRRAFVAGGMSVAEIAKINAIKVELSARDPKKEAGEEAVGQAEQIRQWAPVAFVYILFVSILTVSQMLLSSTIEEKSNRIVEVLLSSVTPSELMLGKLLGVAAIGITMIVAWFGFGWLMLESSGNGPLIVAIRTVLVAPELLGAFVVYFLLGYLLYASILLALGSVCNTLKDAQNFMAPVTMILMVPLLTMMFVAKDPNGSLAVILSWIPFFTPFVMMNRAAASVPMSEVVGTMALLVASLVFVIWIAGRIFRNGILRTGQPPKLLEMLKLARG
jgi:ABC-2 type transport system permease protein